SVEQPLPLDGRDAWPAIASGAASPHDAILYNTTPYNGAIRMGDWKLVSNGQIGETEGPAQDTAARAKKKKKKAAAGKQDELFNLAEDPNEKTNVAAQHPEKVTELKARLAQFAAEAAEPKSS